MARLKQASAVGLPSGAEAFLARMTELPGEGAALLTFADWLQENECPALAEAVRTQTPKIVKRYQQAIECLDTMLSIDLERVTPYPMPRPDRERYRSRAQLVAIVKAALKPFTVPHLTVATARGWRGGPEVELRLPAADLGVGDGQGAGFLLPWGSSSAAMLAAGVLVFTALMPSLFPDEQPRVVHDDGESFPVPFWRPEIRFQPNP